MNLNKLNLWIIGSALIIAGTLLYYFEDYRNSQIISWIYSILIIIGWALIVGKMRGNSINAPKILFKEDKAGWFKQHGLNLICGLILIALIVGNFYYISQLAHDRKLEILENGPTKTTIAIVDHIDERRSRHTTSYYAVFKYTANGTVTSHAWHEYRDDDFLIGDKYMIKYSVEYPGMMMIMERMP